MKFPLKDIKKSNRESLSLRNSASTVSINGYHETPLDIINCQESEFRRNRWEITLV